MARAIINTANGEDIANTQMFYDVTTLPVVCGGGSYHTLTLCRHYM